MPSHKRSTISRYKRYPQKCATISSYKRYPKKKKKKRMRPHANIKPPILQRVDSRVGNNCGRGYDGRVNDDR